jgi:hypothetical protein
MITRDDVKYLVDALGEFKIDPAVEIETAQFGLAAYLFDPVSAEIITLAQPRRADTGQSEILLTPMQAQQAVGSARLTHIHNIRAAGYASIEDYNTAHVRAMASRDLAHKQALARAKLDDDHAEAVSKAAAEAGPKAGVAAQQNAEVERHPYDPNLYKAEPRDRVVHEA